MIVSRRTMIGASLAAGISARTAGQTLRAGASEPNETIELWPSGAPGKPSTPLVETLTERSTDPQLNDRALFGISRPRIVVFRPANPNGAAILITPGGGYRWVVVDKEGYELARWFAARGVTVFVLFYRLPGEGWLAGPNVALSDAQRAMRLIRHRATDFSIDPNRVAAMGFSAGGHLCCDLNTRFAATTYAPVDKADAHSARPSLSAPIYPVVSMSAPLAHMGSRAKLLGLNPPPALEMAHSPHLHVSATAPPMFLVHAEDDAIVRPENSLLMRAALRSMDVPVETHLFARGGHGFGLRKAIGKPAQVWPQLFLDWAQSMHWGG